MNIERPTLNIEVESQEDDPRSAFDALQQSFGASAEFPTISHIPVDLRDPYYRFWVFLEKTLKAARDPLLTEEMWIDSFIGLNVSRGSDHWKADGWIICGWVANPGGHQWDVGFSAIFPDRAEGARCEFRRATKYDSLGSPFFAVNGGAP